MSRIAIAMSSLALVISGTVAYTAFGAIQKTSWKCGPVPTELVGYPTSVRMSCESDGKTEEVSVLNHALEAIYNMDRYAQKYAGRRRPRLSTTCEGDSLRTAFCQVFKNFGGRRDPEFVWEGYPCELESISGVGNSNVDGTCKSGIIGD